MSDKKKKFLCIYFLTLGDSKPNVPSYMIILNLIRTCQFRTYIDFYRRSRRGKESCLMPLISEEYQLQLNALHFQQRHEFNPLFYQQCYVISFHYLLFYYQREFQHTIHQVLLQYLTRQLYFILANYITKQSLNTAFFFFAILECSPYAIR